MKRWTRGFINSWVRSVGHSPLFWWGGTSSSQTSAGIIIQLTGNISGLNALFASVFNNKTCYSLGTQPPALVDRDGEQNKPFMIHDEIFLDLLRKLDAYKSMGPDGLHPRVLKELADVVAKPLSIIFQQSWLTRDVSVDWKLANVMPIFKKGQKDDPGSYRPISLTSVPGKAMEQIISRVMREQSKINQGIRPSQRGFTNSRSCLTNLISIYDNRTTSVL